MATGVIWRMLAPGAQIRRIPNNDPVFIKTQHKDNNNDDNGISALATAEHQQDKEEFPRHHHTIGKAFYPVIFPLKALGVSPLYAVRRGEFYTAGSKWTILWTTGTLLFILTTLTIYALNSFGMGWPVKIFIPYLNNTETGITITASPTTFINDPNLFTHVILALRFFIPFSCLVSGFFGLVHLSSFTEFLNRWSEFSQRLEDTFGRPHHCRKCFQEIPRIRDWYFYLFVVPTVAIAYLGTPYFAMTGAGSLIHIGEEYFWVGVGLTMFFTGNLVSIRISSCVKDFLSLIVLATAYKELRKGVQVQYADLQETITKAEVQSWLRLVLFIKEQGVLLQTHMGPQNVWFLFECFMMTLSVLAASTLAIIHDREEYIAMVVSCIGVSVGIILFLFWKAELAEAITFEEEQFMEAIVEMTGTNNCETRLEMKSLCDMIMHDPINISFGNVIVLTKRLILSFCSQLAAVLIIMLQFVNH